MKTRPVLFFSILIPASLILIYIIFFRDSPRAYRESSNQSMQQNSQRSKWTLTTKYGVDLWVAMNRSWDSPPGDGWRRIYAFMEERYFTEDNLRKLFTSMAEEYNQPRELSISIYSDEEVLTQRIDHYLADLAPAVKKRQEQEKDKQEKRKYFYARYHRQRVYLYGVREEWFEYNPDPNKDEPIRIILSSEKLEK